MLMNVFVCNDMLSFYLVIDDKVILHELILLLNAFEHFWPLSQIHMMETSGTLV